MTGARQGANASRVGTLRHFFRARPGLAAWLLAAALCLKAFVPTGYMPSVQGGALTVELCSGSAPAGSKVVIHIARKGGGHDASATADHPCAFSSHSAAALDAALPVLLAAALLFVFVAAIRYRPLALRPLRARVRPPLRGPPLPA